jgi:hypothetical protein
MVRVVPNLGTSIGRAEYRRTLPQRNDMRISAEFPQVPYLPTNPGNCGAKRAKCGANSRYRGPTGAKLQRRRRIFQWCKVILAISRDSIDP